MSNMRSRARNDGDRGIVSRTSDRLNELDWHPTKALRSLRNRFEDLDFADRKTVGVAAALGLGLAIGLTAALLSRGSSASSKPGHQRGSTVKNKLKKERAQSPSRAARGTRKAGETGKKAAVTKAPVKRGPRQKPQQLASTSGTISNSVPKSASAKKATRKRTATKAAKKPPIVIAEPTPNPSERRTLKLKLTAAGSAPTSSLATPTRAASDAAALTPSFGERDATQD